MSTAESTDEIAPRSVLRHRPIGESKPPTGKRAMVTAVLPEVARTPRLRPPIETKKLVEGEPRVRMEGKIAGEEQKGSIKRASSTRVLPQPAQPPLEKPHTGVRVLRGHAHPLLYFGIGMLGMLMLGSIVSLCSGWFMSWHDDLLYGRPRTFQRSYLGY